MMRAAAGGPARSIPRAPRPGRPLFRLGLCALSLLAFGASGEVFRRLLPWPDEAGLATKLDDYLTRAEQYDVLFLGSSRVARGIVPAVVDEVLAGSGHALRSYNLGVDAIALAGRPDDVRDQLKAWHGLADHVLLYPPSIGVSPGRAEEHLAAIVDTFATSP